MKSLEIFVLTLFVLVFAGGCDSRHDGETSETATKAEITKAEVTQAEVADSDEKMVIINGINATDVAWVFDREPYGSLEYREEVDAIDAEDFSVAPGETFLYFNTPVSDMKNYDSYFEMSENTYEIRIQLIAGGPTPTDGVEQYVYAPFPAVVDFIISGTYGVPVTVEWNGTAFKQLD